MHSPEFEPAPHDAQKEQQETVSVDSYDYKTMPEDARADLRAYIQEEEERTYDAALSQREKIRRNNASFNNMKNLEFELRDGEESIVSLARDPATKKVIGAGIVVIDQNQADPTNRAPLFYISRGALEGKKGIGTALILRQHEILRERGIRTYTTKVNKYSLALYKKLGIPFQEKFTLDSKVENTILVSVR